MRFTTINSDLFAKAKEAQIPDWIESMPTDFEKPTMDLEFEQTASWAEKQTVNRDTRDYQPKEIKAKLNDNEIILAKTELAKFLKKKHYNIKTASIKDDVVTLTTTLSNIPGEFEFMFDKKNNKIKLANIFNYNNEFYPFNQAGLNECLSAIDVHNPIAMKVEADKASIISTQEIYRRYNGHIRQATDRIKELLKDGSIVGVTSDSFGTFLDVDYLFPQQEKEGLSNKAPQFEFVANIEKTKTTEAKSAYQLAMEASKLFNEYDDFKINDYKRKDNTLYVKASILSNNQTKDVKLKFDIKDEKIVNRSMPKFTSINSFNKQNRIHQSNLIDKKHLSDVLKNNGYFTDVDDVISDLVKESKLQQVSNTQFTSKYSINELVNSLKLKKDNKKLAKLTDKVQDLRVNREFLADTGVRDAEELVSEKTLLNAVNQFLIKYFDNYTITYFNISQGEELTFIDAEVNVFNEDNGLDLLIIFNFECNGNDIINYHIRINGQDSTIEEIQEAYDINQALVNYLDEKTAKRVKSNIVFSKQAFVNKLSKIAKVNNVDKTLDLLLKQDKIQQLANDKFASRFTLEQLINISNVQALSKDTIKNNIIKAQANKSQRLSGIYTQDTLDRDIIDVWSDNEIEIYITNLISKVFTTFNIEQIQKIDDTYITSINAVDEDGITKPMVVKIDSFKNHPNDIIDIVKPNSNETVREYLLVNKPNLYSAKGILTQKQLEDNLLDVIDINEFNTILNLLVDNVLIEPLFEDKYILNNTMSEIVSFIDKNNKVNTTANKEKLSKAVRTIDYREDKVIMDNDTREVKQEAGLTLAGLKVQDKLLREAKLMYNNQKLTLRKFKEITSNLKDIKNERELDKIAKLLNDYK